MKVIASSLWPIELQVDRFYVEIVNNSHFLDKINQKESSECTIYI